MSLSKYNSYPKDMREISPTDKDELQDLFTYCWESEEGRQAYKSNDFYSHHEALRIVWIRESENLGYAIGDKAGIIKYYKIGKEEDWQMFNGLFSAQFKGDYS